jgi:hypothetical protein
MKVLRVPRLIAAREDFKDIRVAQATIVACKVNGEAGWALPGCKFTTRHSLAFSVCEKMNNIILELGGISPAMKVKRAA